MFASSRSVESNRAPAITLGMENEAPGVWFRKRANPSRAEQGSSSISWRLPQFVSPLGRQLRGSGQEIITPMRALTSLVFQAVSLLELSCSLGL